LSDAQQDELGAMMEEALSHQTANRSDTAGTLYRRVLTAAPNTHDALHMLGVIEMGFGNLQRAEELILGAMKLRPPYPAIETNVKLLRESQIDQARATQDQLAERALPILNDLMLVPIASGRAAGSASPSDTLHIIGRLSGGDGDDDAWMVRRLSEVLACSSPTVWAADGMTSLSCCSARQSTIDPRSGQYPRGGTQVFVGVDYELGDWVKRSRADRIIVVCGRGRPSLYIDQLRALAMDGARRIELAFVSSVRADRFGPGHALIPLPIDSVDAPLAIAPAPRETGVWSISEPRGLSVGMMGQTSGSVDEPTDHAVIAEIAAHTDVTVICDPGRYRFSLGANASIRFVSSAKAGLVPFIASVDCFYCRRQQWWDEGIGREVLMAMALGKPVLCPRGSMHSWLIEDQVDGLLYETPSQALALLKDLHRARGWMAQLGSAARRKARHLIDVASRDVSYRAIFSPIVTFSRQG